MLLYKNEEKPVNAMFQNRPDAGTLIYPVKTKIAIETDFTLTGICRVYSRMEFVR